MVSTQNIINRQIVIPGAQDDGYSVAYGGIERLTMKKVSHIVSQTAIHTLNATPVELLPAPPTGKRYAVFAAYSSKASGGYTGGAVIAIQYSGTGTPNAATLPATHFRAVGTNTAWASRVAPAGAPNAFALGEGSVRLTTTTAFADAGGPVTVTIFYAEVDE